MSSDLAKDPNNTKASQPLHWKQEQWRVLRGLVLLLPRVFGFPLPAGRRADVCISPLSLLDSVCSRTVTRIQRQHSPATRESTKSAYTPQRWLACCYARPLNPTALAGFCGAIWGSTSSSSYSLF